MPISMVHTVATVERALRKGPKGRAHAGQREDGYVLQKDLNFAVKPCVPR
jgi:hypothetical protein